MADVPVNNEVPSIVVTVLTNGQVLFDYDFRADAADDLQAEYRYANGNRLDLAGGVDFTATGLGTAAGGTITLTTFIDTVAGDTIAIYRKIPIERTTDYSRDLFADDLNAEQDRLFMIAQELRRDIDRAVKADFGDNPDTLVEDLFAAALQAEADAAAAAASASASAASQVAASGSASSASASATNASNSATAADASADAAAASQAAAAGSASSASTSATNAGNSATAAAGSASAASTSATNAANSATAAGTSATNAANSATAAAGSASAANTSATNAANSATAAGASADAAAASAAAADSAITNRLASQATAALGANATELVTPLTARVAIDSSVRMEGTVAANTFGMLTLSGSGARSIVHVADEGYVLQSAGVSFINLAERPRVKGRTYRIKARIRSTVQTGVERVYVGFTLVDNAGVQTHTYPAANNINLAVAAGWATYEGTLDCDTLASNIVKIIPRVLLNYNVTTGTQQMQYAVCDHEEATQVNGASSSFRTYRARWSDTVNLRDWFDRTGAEGTETVNNAALAALITYLNANPQVRTLKGNKGDVYRTTATNQTLPTNLRFMGDDARFRWSGLLGGGNSQFIQFSTGSHIEGLAVDIVTGSTFRRLLGTEDACKLYDWEILSESQINNAPTSGLLDWALRVYRSNNKVRGIKIQNIDKAFFGYGADGDGAPGVDNHFEDIRAISYATGICLRNLKRAKNLNPYVKDRSANATDDPGFNGILHEGVSEYLLANAQVFDAGEHGIRFGGTRNAEQISEKIIINGAQIVRPGQSGLKFFTGVAGGSFTNVQGSNIQVIDCQYEPLTPAEGPGFNDEGFLLQQIRKGTFNGLSVERHQNATYSCMDGVYISGADDLQINGLHVQDPKRNAVRISEYDGDTAPNSVETLANNEVFIRGLRGENIGEDGVFIDSPVQSLRDINIEGEVIGNGAAGFYAFDCSAAVARFAQPSLVQLKQRNFAAGATSLATSGNWKFRDVFGSVY